MKRGPIYFGTVNFNGATIATTSYLMADGVNNDGTRKLKIVHASPAITALTSADVFKSEAPQAGATSCRLVYKMKKVTHTAGLTFDAAKCGVIVRPHHQSLVPSLRNFGAGVNHIGPYIQNSSGNGVGISEAFGNSPVYGWRGATGSIGECDWYIAKGANTVAWGQFDGLDSQFEAIVPVGISTANCVTNETYDVEVFFVFGGGENE